MRIYVSMQLVSSMDSTNIKRTSRLHVLRCPFYIDFILLKFLGTRRELREPLIK